MYIWIKGKYIYIYVCTALHMYTLVFSVHVCMGVCVYMTIYICMMVDGGMRITDVILRYI